MRLRCRFQNSPSLVNKALAEDARQCPIICGLREFPAFVTSTVSMSAGMHHQIYGERGGDGCKRCPVFLGTAL